MLEVLVLYMCLSEQACKEMSQQYYKTNFQMQEKVKTSRKRLERYMGKEALVTSGTFLLAAMDKKIKVRITRNFILTYDSKEVNGDLKWEF